jgi:hypothetical protein
MRQTLLLTLLCVGVLAFLPAREAEAANWSGNVRVAAIEISNVNAAGVWVSFTSAPYSSHNCSTNNGQYMLGGGAANVDKMTSAATQALLYSRNVAVFWGGGCSGGGTTGYPILLGLTLK